MPEALLHTPAQWRTYVALVCGASACVLAAVATLNYQVDPYLIHQWDTKQVQQLRPAREKLSAWGKTYALARFQPDVLYLGNSRTELGLPSISAQFAGRTVFNAALSGASLGDAIAMARHAVVVGRPTTVVWGIDAPSFSLEVGNTEFDRALVADDRWYLLRRRLIDIGRALTIDMTLDSVRLLQGSFGAVCRSSLALHGQRDAVCVRDRIDGWGGTRAAIVPRIREFMRGAGPTGDAMTGFAASIAKLCEHGVQLRVYINPTHAMTIEALHQAGKGGVMAHWQQQLAALFATWRGHGCDARIYDFSGFNSVTTEAVPQHGGFEDMRYYWETSHYRVNVGHMILARMFGAGSAPDDFGVELAPAMLSAHQARQQVARALYRREQAQAAAMVKELVARR